MSHTTIRSQTEAEQADTLKDQVAEMKRQHILEAAIQVFAAKGYHRSTVKEIAAAAGIAEGTIYNYFGGKADLLAAMIDRMMFSSLRELFARKGDAGANELLGAVLRDRIEFIRANRDLFLAVFPEVIANEELRQRVLGGQILPFVEDAQGFITRGKNAGQLRDVEPGVLSTIFVGLVIGTAFMELVKEEADAVEIPDDTLVSGVVDVLFNGMLKQGEVG